MKPVPIETNYSPALYRAGLPYRLRGDGLNTRQVFKSYSRGDDTVGWREQSHQFMVAKKDDPGWLCYITANSTVDPAKHIAANIMQAYFERELEARWLKTLDGFKPDMSVSLYIMDTLFDDDTTFRRSMFYDVLRKIDGPHTSAILIGKSVNPTKFVHFLGLKPHLLMNVK